MTYRAVIASPTSFADMARWLAKELQRIEQELSAGPVISGLGTPEGAVAAPVGKLYVRQDGPPVLYVKESGSGATGWVAK